MTQIVMTDAGERHYRYLTPVAVIFAGALIVSNIIAIKVINISGLVGGWFDYFQPAAIIIFPVSYIIGDILTEVYGYAVARRVIWSGFFANALAVLAIVVTQELPAAPFWDDQEAYEAILGQTWRIVGGSFTALLVGEFANSFVLARLKRVTQGRYLWTRTIASTVVGQGLDSAVFMTIAFFGTATIANGGSALGLRLAGVADQDPLRDRRHAPHLPRGEHDEAAGRRGRVRRRHELQPAPHPRRPAPARGARMTRLTPAPAGAASASPWR